MRLNILKNGPYVHAMGWTSGPPYAASAKSSQDWSQLKQRVSFSETGSAKLISGADECESQEAKLAPLPTPYMRASGISRAKSAACSSVFGATVAKELKRVLADTCEIDGQRVGLAMVSSTAILPIFWRFESVGLSVSWQMTDTTLLPASIPSSVVTASSMVTDSHAAAVTLGDGAFGMVAGIELAFLNFHHGRADHYMVIGADEVCKQMLASMDGFGTKIELVDGAAGVVLSKERLAGTDWQVGAVGFVREGQALELDGEWAKAHKIRVEDADGLCGYSACLVPHAMHQAVKESSDDAVLLEFSSKGRGSAYVGLMRGA